MSRENTYHAIILKKQPFNESDELITVYTKQAGKLRLLGKSTKAAKSKLSFGLQTLFLVKLTLTSGQLPKVIGVEVLDSFGLIRDSERKMEMGFYLAELMLKFTPDEQTNERLFNLAVDFLSALNSERDESLLGAILAKWEIEFLEAMGLGIHLDNKLIGVRDLGFSNSLGGFVLEAADITPVAGQTPRQFLELKKSGFTDLKSKSGVNFAELHQILSNFLRYQLEREIRSEKFLEI